MTMFTMQEPQLHVSVVLTAPLQADGNPKLHNDDYQWINLDNQSEVTDGPVLTITQNMAGGCFTYRCEACNEYLDQRPCVTSDKHFYVSSECITLVIPLIYSLDVWPTEYCCTD